MTNFVSYSRSIVRDFRDTKRCPNVPGVYVVTTGQRVLYVGKATVSIRKRHSQKFYPSASPSDKDLVRRAHHYGDCRVHCIPISFGSYWISSVEGRLIRKLGYGDRKLPECNDRNQRISPLISALELVLCIVFGAWDCLRWGVGCAALGYLGMRLWQVLAG